MIVKWFLVMLFVLAIPLEMYMIDKPRVPRTRNEVIAGTIAKLGLVAAIIIWL